jgi:uncharacterized protein YukE/surface antigen
MSQTIRMDTEKVHTTGKLFLTNAAKMDALIDELAISIRKLSASWDGGSSDSFCDQLYSLRRQLERKSWELSNLAQQLQREIDEWENADRTLKGESAKKTNILFASTALAGATAATGQVLGASSINIDQLSWKEKFELERSLAAQISEIEGKYQSQEERDGRIAQIDKEIGALEKEREKTQRKADRLLNKILPDFPLEADDEDGVAWRVRTDDFEDQVKEYDNQLSALKTEKANLLQFDTLKQQHLELNVVFEHRLKDVNPNNYGSCALYAAARRPDLGSTQSNFENYTDGAAANYIAKYQDTAFQITAGVDLRDKVGAGFAVIWEPGVQNSNPTYGHVAIVEKVGKDYVEVSHAGWSENPKTITISELQQLWLIP